MTAPVVDRASLWWARRDPRHGEGLRRAAPSELPGHAEVLVVGAGLTGIATAVLLARAGRSPVVVEARVAGSGTTGSSTAKASLLQGSVLQRLQRHTGPDVVSAYVRANRVGQLWLREVVTTHDLPWQERQGVTYAVTPEGARSVEREAEVARRAGLPVVDLEDAGLPFPVLAAIGLPGQFQFDPLDVVDALRADLREHGGTLVEGAGVSEMSWTRPWRVTTAAGEVVADHVVLATQYPVPDRGMYFARLRAERSYAAAYRVQAPDALPVGMYLSVDSPARSVRTAPDPDGDLLVVGGNGHETGRGGSTLARAADLDDWARRHFPVTTAVCSWSAQDYRTARQVPSVGAVPGTNGTLLAATGFDKWGMTNAVAAAHVLVGDLLGDPPEYAAGLRSTGASPADLAASVRHNGSVGVRWVTDRAARLLPTSARPEPADGEGWVEGGALGPTAVSTDGGRTCRVSAVCPHLAGIVSWNDAERSWDCPLHGSRFAADGTRLEGPATSDLPHRD
ncbi:MAG TPA: FAD-dependent oxidoreductase [Ornithinibacter sp.]|nr:FAD-dependent oxidoreductase [Ornithinibacter sp.]